MTKYHDINTQGAAGKALYRYMDHTAHSRQQLILFAAAFQQCFFRSAVRFTMDYYYQKEYDVIRADKRIKFTVDEKEEGK